MKFSGYNLINQKLHSEWLIKLLRFCANDYSGVVGESEENDPFTLSGTTKGSTFTLSSCLLTVGGHTIDMSESESTPGETLSGDINDFNHTFYAIVLGLSADKQTTNITTNELTTAYAGYVSDFTITALKHNNTSLYDDPYTGYYSILQDETNEGWTRYHYDTKQFTSVTITPAGTNNDITINDAYVIPVVGWDTEKKEVVRLLGYKTGKSLEEFLTQAALDKLLDMLDDKFVWRTGGITKGDIGNLNIRGNNIYCDGDTSIDRNDTQYYLKNSVTIRADYIRFCRVRNSEWGKEEEVDNFFPRGVLIVPDKQNFQRGIDSVKTLPIDLGGTNATTVNRARRNLGIVTSADRNVSNNGKPPSSTSTWQPEDGTIYLSIVN